MRVGTLGNGCLDILFSGLLLLLLFFLNIIEDIDCFIIRK